MARGSASNCPHHNARPYTGRHPFYTALFKHCPITPTGYVCTPGNPGPSWAPLSVADVSWNFEKVLVGRDGTPTMRYAPAAMGPDMEPEIERLLRQRQ